MADYYFKLDKLTIGYNQKPLIENIEIGINKGEIVAIIGPNGSGKSTILKSVTRQLGLLSGKVWIEDKDLYHMSFRDMSKKMAVVLTDRMKPELMTCHDIVATGRYPYTGKLGILTKEDEDKVEEAMKAVDAESLGDKSFDAISDGQRQRVLLARAICQEPEIILLDEPTSFLDIRYKLELLSILRRMAKQNGITVITSLHEIDLAEKIADKILCVSGEHLVSFGEPDKVFKADKIRDLYGIRSGSFDTLFGSIELPKPEGKPKVFVISSGSQGVSWYRKLQKEAIPFAAGILYKDSVDYRLARTLASRVVTEQAFCEITEDTLKNAKKIMDSCESAILAGLETGPMNRRLKELVEYAKNTGKLKD